MYAGILLGGVVGWALNIVLSLATKVVLPWQEGLVQRGDS